MAVDGLPLEDKPNLPEPEASVTSPSHILRDAVKYLLSSKTLLLWIFIFFVALAAIILATVLAWAVGIEMPYLDRFFDLLEWGGTGGTARNVISDGVMPRVPQITGAWHKPEVALGSPQSMTMANAQTAGGWSPPQITITQTSQHT